MLWLSEILDGNQKTKTKTKNKTKQKKKKNRKKTQHIIDSRYGNHICQRGFILSIVKNFELGYTYTQGYINY